MLPYYRKKVIMNILVIGGVAAGTKAAAKLKRLDRSAEITIVTKSADISYAGCGLPYYIGGVIESKSDLIVNTPQKFTALTGVPVRTQCEVISINPEEKTVCLQTLSDGNRETLSYDACIIASGASPVIPSLPGVQLPGVFPIRTPDDAEALRDYVSASNARRAVVVGGGFIGLEVAENLMAQGLRVTVMDMAPEIMPGFDPELSQYARRHLSDKGISVLTSAKLERITGEGKAQAVQTDKGTVAADVVVLSMGIRPNTAFLEGTGIEMVKGTIVVDDQMRTNLPDLYAAGDCCMVKNSITGAQQWAPMGSSANLEGRTLARVLAGEDAHFSGVVGTGIVKLPGLNCAKTGLTESAAKQAGYDVITALTVADDKAHYYPDSASFIIKLVADKSTRRLLGAQVMGAGAVDKIADIAVTAISMRASLDQLETLDLAYAPPFSTAISPFVTAVHVLQNKLSGKLDSFTPAEFAAGAAAEYRILDAAPMPSIPGATHVDLTAVNGMIDGIGRDEKLLLVCAKGKRAYFLQNRLKYYGYTNTKVLEGATYFNVMPAPKGGAVTVSAQDIKRVKALGFLHCKGTDNFNCRVITRNGKISAAESQCITQAAEQYGNGDIAMTSRLTIEIQGVPYQDIDNIRAYLAQAGLETGGTGSKVRPVVSCKGTTCQYGLLDSFALSDEIHERFYHGYGSVKLPHKFKIAVGGCPNNCVKPNLNDLGIVGQRISQPNLDACRGCGKCQIEMTCPVHAAHVVDGKLSVDPTVCNNCGRCVGKCPFHATDASVYGYRVYIGGRWGKRTAHGIPLETVFTSKNEVLSIVEKAILLFREQGETGERFADTIARIGFDNVQAQLLSDDILTRRDQIIGAKMHLTGGATC